MILIINFNEEMDWSAEPWASLVGFLTGEATQGEWQGEWFYNVSL